MLHYKSGRLALWCRRAGKAYRTFLLSAMTWLYAGIAYAQVFDENKGPFADITCSALKWLTNALLPIAAIAAISVIIGMLWGEEIKGIMKTLLNIIMAFSCAAAFFSILGFIAKKFNFGSSSCSL